MKKLLTRFTESSSTNALVSESCSFGGSDQEIDTVPVKSVLKKPFIDGFLIESPFLMNEWEALHKHWLGVQSSREFATDERWLYELHERDRLCSCLCVLVIHAVRDNRDGKHFHLSYRRESIKLWNQLQSLAKR
jgi:hypothetical protein